MTSLRDYNAAVDFVDRHVAEGRGDKTAFVDPLRNLTYSELRDAAARIGPMLAHLGIERENRIALVMLDTVEFPILFWGAIRAGIVPVLLNTRLTVDQYRYLLEDSRAKAVFVSTALLPIVQEAAKELPTLKTLIVVGGGPDPLPRFDRLLAAENEGAAPARTCADEVAYWLYSSGTTGMPKGVMHVHSSPKFIAQSSGQRRIGYREDDVVFSAAKAFFAYGLGSAIICPTWVGATTVLYPERPTPQTVCETIRAYQPSLFFAVPTLYAAILADAECKAEHLPERLRVCFSAGEPLPAAVGEAWKARFGLDIVDGVGSSEMGHLFVTNKPGAVEYGTCGVAVDGYELKLVDENGREVADDEIGELLVRGESMAHRLLEPAREVAAHFRRRMAAHRRQICSARGWRLYLLRPHRRHVQGERHLGLAVRSRGGADHPSAGAGSRGRAGRRRQRPDQAEGLCRAQGLSRRRGRPRALRRVEGACEAFDRLVEISALDRIRRQPAEDRYRQNPALHAARHGRRRRA